VYCYPQIRPSLQTQCNRLTVQEGVNLIEQTQGEKDETECNRNVEDDGQCVNDIHDRILSAVDGDRPHVFIIPTVLDDLHSDVVSPPCKPRGSQGPL
jgi:hypothetical protein